MKFSEMKGIGDVLQNAQGLAMISTVAGSGDDGAEQDGETIQRSALTGGPFNSAHVVFPYSTTLADTKTLTLVANLQDSPAGSSWTDITGATFASAVVETADDPALTFHGNIEINLDLTNVEDYIRCQVTPTLSAANTDTAIVGCVFIFAGAQKEFPL